jgi:hypothetical protein
MFKLKPFLTEEEWARLDATRRDLLAGFAVIVEMTRAASERAGGGAEAAQAVQLIEQLSAMLAGIVTGEVTEPVTGDIAAGTAAVSVGGYELSVSVRDATREEWPNELPES